MLYIIRIIYVFFVDAGTITKCEMEGEEIFVPYISDDPCFSCRCQVNINTDNMFLRRFSSRSSITVNMHVNF